MTTDHPVEAHPLDPALLEILRCPACREPFAEPAPDSLTCTGCGRRYPIRNGIPVLLVDEATGGPDSEVSAAGPVAG